MSFGNFLFMSNKYDSIEKVPSVVLVAMIDDGEVNVIVGVVVVSEPFVKFSRQQKRTSKSSHSFSFICNCLAHTKLRISIIIQDLE